MSRAYVHDILKGNVKPSIQAAVRIFRATGWRHDILMSLTEDEIETVALVAARKAAA